MKRFKEGNLLKLRQASSEFFDYLSTLVAITKRTHLKIFDDYIYMLNQLNDYQELGGIEKIKSYKHRADLFRSLLQKSEEEVSTLKKRIFELERQIKLSQ